MSWYLIVFQGGNAIGSALLGIAAQQTGLTTTLIITAGGLLLAPLAAIRFPLRPIDPSQLLPAGDWPTPIVTLDDDLDSGLVLVNVDYHPLGGHEDELMTTLAELRYSRRRTGASSRRVWRALDRPDMFIESFMVASWEEHLRQHERVTVADRDRQRCVQALVDPQHPPAVHHLIAAAADLPHHPPRPIASGVSAS